MVLERAARTHDDAAVLFASLGRYELAQTARLRASEQRANALLEAQRAGEE